MDGSVYARFFSTDVDRYGERSCVRPVGSVLFTQKVTVYIVLIIVSAVWWCLYRTKLGITIRGSGDYPSAVDTAGYTVTRVRFFFVLFAGAAAGGAGAMLSVAEVGIFRMAWSMAADFWH